MADTVADGVAQEAIAVSGVAIDPVDGPLGAPLSLAITFKPVETEIADGIWRYSFVVDSARKRKVVELGAVGPATYAAGEETTVAFEVDGIDFSRFKRSRLLNTGLLVAKLFANGGGDGDGGDEEVLQVTSVVQVSADPETGDLVRLIFSPL